MNKSNQNISFKGGKLQVSGRELREGDKLPNFKLVGADMTDLNQDKYKGKTLVLCAVPSIDTPVCSIEGKRFNQELGKLPSSVHTLFVSVDLPFALKRWCGAEGISRLETASDYKYHTFGETFGVYSPDMGLFIRAVFVVDPQGTIRHIEYVTDISQEPDYEAILKTVKAIAV